MGSGVPLSFRPLWALSRLLETELPSLLCARVSLEESELLELLSELYVIVEKGSGDGVSEGLCLAVDSASGEERGDLELLGHLGLGEGVRGDSAELLGGEVLLEGEAVQLKRLLGRRGDAGSGSGGLASADCLEVFGLCLCGCHK